MGTAYAQYRFVMTEVSLYNSNVTKRTYIPEFAFRHPALNHLAVLIEAKPINNKQDLVCQPMVPFPVLLRRVYLTPRLRFTDDTAVVQLVAPVHQQIKRIFNASL